MVLEVALGVHTLAAELAVELVAAGAGVQLRDVTLQVAFVAQDFVAMDTGDAYAPLLHPPVTHDLQLVLLVVKHHTGLVRTPLPAFFTQVSFPVFLLSAVGVVLIVGLKRLSRLKISNANVAEVDMHLTVFFDRH